MISFELTEEQHALQDMVAKFARNEIMPIAAECDRSGEFPFELAQKAHELGLINISIPEEFGGSDLGMLEVCLVAEELAYGCAGMATSFLVNEIALTPLLLSGSLEQKENFLKPVCSSKEVKFASFALTEPGAGSDAAMIKTKAERTEGGYVINGRKTFITGGDIATFFVVFASTDPSKGHKGISAFIVPKELGVEIGKEEDKMGIRASHTVELIFEDVRVPRENLLGVEGAGFYVAMGTLDLTRAMAAAVACGLAQRALDEALNYASERVQFGKPLLHHQLIQGKLADMSMEIDAARLLTWRAAWLGDQGKKLALESAQAKAFAADVAMKASIQALQIFGGYGYMKDYPIEKLMRDAKIFQIYEGTSEVQRLVIAAELAKKLR
ncbi:MAG TPA: acyl-CoA dehydrogenase family protein [Syntrophales bacterium]|nr:acyl-CoA dehydrogenase family protein [Syntrophales bacterium]